MYCRDCARYDAALGKCLDGKVNPERWETAISVAQVLGLRSICVFNDHRERIVQSRKPIVKGERLDKIFDPDRS